jgi:YidC/Oxa1 family membrane protein insertase
MEKNTVIAIALSTVVVVAGFTLQNVIFPPEKSTPVTQSVNAPVVNAAQNTTTSGSAVSTDAPVVAANSPVSGADASGTAKDSPAATSTAANVPAEQPLAETTYVIETKLVRAEFTNNGGDIVSYLVKDRNGKNAPVEMADHITADNRAFSVIFGDSTGTPVNQLFRAKVINDTSIGFFQDFAVTNKDGTTSRFTLVKQYTFNPDDYMFELKVTVDGDASLSGLQFNNVAYTIKTSPQIGPKWNEKDQYEFRKFYQMENGKKKVLSTGAEKTDRSKNALTWAGVSGKYFALVVLPDSGIQQAVYSRVSSSDSATSAQMFLSRAPITASKTTDTWHVYIGPRTENELGKYNVAANNPYKLDNVKIDQVIDSSGILAPLEVLLKWIMEIFYFLIPNWGVSIIIMTLLMRIIIFPLTKKSSEASLRMQELQPKMQEIQTKYKENPQKMNEEMAKFYQSVGYNPLSGCLPILIQFPLIFAMYNLFNNYFEFRGALFIPGWIPDLSQGDSVLKFGFSIPLLNWTELRLLPIIYVISQLFYGKFTQIPGGTQQNSTMKLMMYGMPLFFFFIFYNAPSGLLIYWIFSNVLTLVQQIIINKMMHAKKTAAGTVVPTTTKPVKTVKKSKK